MRRYDRKKLPLKAFEKLELALMPTRHESTIITSISIKSEKIHNFLKENDVKIFAFVLYACLKTVNEFPVLKRFVLNSQLYEHKNISVSTVMKRDKTVAGDSTLAKLKFDPEDSLQDVQAKLNQATHQTRSGAGIEADKLIEGFGKMPTWMFKLAIKIMMRLDSWDLLPNSIIDDDPFHATAVIANLGGIDGFSVLHHLYNWGTASMFLTFGRLQDDGSLDVTFSVDERISEGMVLFKALAYFTAIMEHPYDHV